MGGRTLTGHNEPIIRSLVDKTVAEIVALCLPGKCLTLPDLFISYTSGALANTPEHAWKLKRAWRGSKRHPSTI